MQNADLPDSTRTDFALRGTAHGSGCSQQGLSHFHVAKVTVELGKWRSHLVAETHIGQWCRYRSPSHMYARLAGWRIVMHRFFSLPGGSRWFVSFLEGLEEHSPSKQRVSMPRTKLSTFKVSRLILMSARGGAFHNSSMPWRTVE